MKQRKEIAASPGDRVQRPQDWDKAISCAYLRLIGRTQAEAAEGAGVGERTLQDWEACSWWATAEREAQGRWLRGIDAKARAALEQSLTDPKEYAISARWWADRRVAELAPPKVKQEHSGPDGESLGVVVRFVKAEGEGK